MRKEKPLSLKYKRAIIADKIEQIQKLNFMIELHINSKSEGMVGQYDHLRHRQIGELQELLNTLFLKVEDTAFYYETFMDAQTPSSISVEKIEMDYDEKIAIAKYIVEQIDKLNPLIEMNQRMLNNLTIVEQYSTLRHRMIGNLQSVLATLHLKVADTAFYVENYEATYKAIQNGSHSKVEVAELELV